MDTRKCYLLRSNEIYYFRIKIPKALRNHFKSRQIKKSLYTKDLEKATKHAIFLKRYVDILFNSMERDMLTENQIKSLVNEYCNIQLKNHEDGIDVNAVSDIPIDSELMREKYEKGI